MSEKNNYSELLRLLAGDIKPPSPNPFAQSGFSSIPGSVPAASLAGLRNIFAPPAKPKPPALSVEHMRGIVEESLGKKLNVNPGRQMPTIYDLAIGEGRHLNAAFVYTDLDGYSKMVSANGTGVAFQLLQTFVNLIEKITDHFNGAVVDCAGDRTLSVFHRPSTDRSCAPIREGITAALWIQTAMDKVISPRFSALNISAKASIGIDYSPVIAGCVGVRGNKRLVFFGDAANRAAKLQEEGTGAETVISPLAFQYRPTYLNNGTWEFETKYDVYGSTPLYYKTSYIFSGDIPLGKEEYLK